jgi:CheY-like chemotaxis protein
MYDSKTESVPVLLVEDDTLVRMDTASFLEGAGFVVHEADNAAAAIRSLELHDEIRLVFTDVNMPGWMNGLALAHYIHGRHELLFRGESISDPWNSFDGS